MTSKLSCLIASATLSTGLASFAFAASPVQLTDQQMDRVTAGAELFGIDLTAFAAVQPTSQQFITGGAQGELGFTAPFGAARTTPTNFEFTSVAPATVAGTQFTMNAATAPPMGGGLGMFFLADVTTERLAGGMNPFSSITNHVFGAD